MVGSWTQPAKGPDAGPLAAPVPAVAPPAPAAGIVLAAAGVVATAGFSATRIAARRGRPDAVARFARPHRPLEPVPDYRLD